MKGRYAGKRDARAVKLPALEWAWACPGNNGGGHAPRIDRRWALFAFSAEDPFVSTTCEMCGRSLTRERGSLDRETWHVPLLVVQEVP